MRDKRTVLVVAAMAAAGLSADLVHGQPEDIGPSRVPVKALLKKTVCAEKEFDKQEIDTVLLWIHEEVYRKQHVGIAFLYSEETAKRRKYLISFKAKKDTNYEAALVEILRQIEARPVYEEFDGLIRIEVAERPKKK